MYQRLPGIGEVSKWTFGRRGNEWTILQLNILILFVILLLRTLNSQPILKIWEANVIKDCVAIPTWETISSVWMLNSTNLASYRTTWVNGGESQLIFQICVSHEMELKGRVKNACLPKKRSFWEFRKKLMDRMFWNFECI